MKTLQEITQNYTLLVDQDLMSDDVMIIVEEEKQTKDTPNTLSHLDHVEDLLIRHGHLILPKSLNKKSLVPKMFLVMAQILSIPENLNQQQECVIFGMLLSLSVRVQIYKP